MIDLKLSLGKSFLFFPFYCFYYFSVVSYKSFIDF